MKSRLLILSVFFLMSLFQASQAQNVKFNNGMVFIENNPVLTYEKSQNNYEMTLFDFSDSPVVVLHYMENGSPADIEDDCVRLHFITDDITVYEYEKVGSWRYILRNLVAQNIIAAEGHVNIPQLIAYRDELNDKLNQGNGYFSL